MSKRLYAEHGSDAFNDWLDRCIHAVVDDARAALGDNLLAIVLGGGYARGEGGVVHTSEGERPYNDLDFTTVVHRKGARIASQLAPVSHHHERILGIDVDFSRPLTVADVRRWPHWLMWTDMLGGHRVLHGPEDILTANAPAAVRGSPPLIEATRLLLNRGAGLLWALRIARGLESAPDPDFIRRNLHKCELAIGDSVPIVHGRHQVLYTGRDRLLKDLLRVDPTAHAFADPHAYGAALRFRLEPGIPPARQPGEKEIASLAGRWGMAMAWVESRRTGISFPDVESYVAWAGIREPALNTLAEYPRNLVRNLRSGKCAWRYPREHLYRQLPPLLHESDSLWEQRSAGFLRVWRQYN